MYPDQQPPQQQYSIDYLNQIAPQQQSTGPMNKILIIVAIVGVIAALIVGALMVFSGGGGPTKDMQTLAVRMQTLHDVTDKARKVIKSGDLQSTNSSLTVLLANANRDIAEPLSKNGVDIKKIDKNITASEKTRAEALAKRLEDARLNAVYDRTYAREMAYELDTVAAIMKKIYTNTKSKSLKEYLLATDKNLKPIREQLSAFNAAND